MITATSLGGGGITTRITDKSNPGSVAKTVQTVRSSSMPNRLKIKTHEAQLRGPPGSADTVELATDPTVWFLIALG